MGIMTLASFIGYLGVCLMVSLSPGPDTFLALRFSLVRQRLGLMAIGGMFVAILGWALVAGAGAATLLQRYPVIETVIAVLGGLYLGYLGLSGLIKSRRVATTDSAIARSAERGALPAATTSARQAFIAGVLSSALNPKIGLLFLAMMPTFIPHGSNTLFWGMVLGATFGLVGCLYLTGLNVAAARAVGWFKKPQIAQRLEWVSCAALMIMGAVVLLSAVLPSH
ncbi:LysE family translocator [Glutamicibacter endophyticus]